MPTILIYRNSSLILSAINHTITSVNLAIDIGNTHTKLAYFKDGKITDSIRIKNTDQNAVMEWIRKRKCKHAIYCSVGRISDAVIALLRQKSGKVICLDQHTSLPFRINYKTPVTLGYDRIAAVSGAYKLFPGENILVFDFGTAITVDLMRSTGEYYGGNISPGLNTRFRSLHEYTAGLPLVERNSNFPFWGEDTTSAVAAGVQQGIIFEVSGYIDACKKQYPNCKFIATGGDAEFVTTILKESVLFYPDLVMEGLNYILDHNTI